MTKKTTLISFVLFLMCMVLGCANIDCIRPRIVMDKIGITKERTYFAGNKKYPFESRYDEKDKASGYFKSNNKNISILIGKEKPYSYFIKCIDSMGNDMWSRSLETIVPGMRGKRIAIYEGTSESLVFLLTEGLGPSPIYKIVIFTEDGNVKIVEKLQGAGGGIFGEYILDINVFSINNEPYIIATGDEGVAIYNLKGERITFLNTKAVTSEVTCIEFKKRNNKYVAIYVAHRSITGSSTLFILNDKFKLMYKEILPNNGVSRTMWIGVEHLEYDDDLIVAAGEIYECTEVGNSMVWKYSFSK